MFHTNIHTHTHTQSCRMNGEISMQLDNKKQRILIDCVKFPSAQLFSVIRDDVTRLVVDVTECSLTPLVSFTSFM